MAAVYYYVGLEINTRSGAEIMQLVEKANCSASSVFLAAKSFMSVVRNAWMLTKGAQKELEGYEKAFWKLANRLLTRTALPARLRELVGKRVVDTMARIIRLRHRQLRQEDRLRIALRLGQRVWLEKEGTPEALAARALRRKYGPAKP